MQFRRRDLNVHRNQHLEPHKWDRTSTEFSIRVVRANSILDYSSLVFCSAKSIRSKINVKYRCGYYPLDTMSFLHFCGVTLWLAILYNLVGWNYPCRYRVNQLVWHYESPLKPYKYTNSHFTIRLRGLYIDECENQRKKTTNKRELIFHKTGKSYIDNRHAFQLVSESV